MVQLYNWTCLRWRSLERMLGASAFCSSCHPISSLGAASVAAAVSVSGGVSVVASVSVVSSVSYVTSVISRKCEDCRPWSK